MKRSLKQSVERLVVAAFLLSVGYLAGSLLGEALAEQKPERNTIPLFIHDSQGVVRETTTIAPGPNVILCSISFADYWSDEPVKARCIARTDDVATVRGVDYTRVVVIDIPVSKRSAT